MKKFQRAAGGLRILATLAVAAAAALGATSAFADKRVALTIGNSAYKNVGRLPNPVNDADAVAKVLRSAGFDLVEARNDLGVAEMRRAISDFSELAAGADIAAVYYAGHGLEVDGTNYLIPVDATLSRDIDVDDEAVSLDRILKVIEPAKRLRLVILDACRDNPFAKTMKRTASTRSMAHGLAKVDPVVADTLIAFAAKAGSVAVDGAGSNSPFTAALVKYIVYPGLDLRIALGKVRDEVLSFTNNKQEPFVYGSLGGAVIALVPGPAEATSNLSMASEANLEIVFWQSIKNEKNPQLFQAYLNRYPNGAFAEIARINLRDQKLAALKSAAIELPSARNDLSDPILVREIRERLYELNFDPGPPEGPIGDVARQAVREFEQNTKVAVTGKLTEGLLAHLREIGGLKPWGAIVYSRRDEKWGMSWAHDTRRAAVASARTSCGDTAQCPTEISFFGTECAVFAHSTSSWSIVARPSMQKAKDDALSTCQKKDKICGIIAAVCADGAERLRSAN